MTSRPRKIRSLRHWKQQYDPHAKFVWRKAPQWTVDHKAVPGEEIPEELAKAPAKLRRFWEAGIIELALFEAPENILHPEKLVTGNTPFEPNRDLDLPELVWVKKSGGLSFRVQVGDKSFEERVENKEALEAYIEQLRMEIAEFEEPQPEPERKPKKAKPAKDDDDWL
jgi:hypothetical protein